MYISFCYSYMRWIQKLNLWKFMNTVDILCPGNSTCETHDLKIKQGTLLKRQLEIFSLKCTHRFYVTGYTFSGYSCNSFIFTIVLMWQKSFHFLLNQTVLSCCYYKNHYCENFSNIMKERVSKWTSSHTYHLTLHI